MLLFCPLSHGYCSEMRFLTRRTSENTLKAKGREISAWLRDDPNYTTLKLGLKSAHAALEAAAVKALDRPSETHVQETLQLSFKRRLR